MAVDSTRLSHPSVEQYGPIEPLALPVLHGELVKLQGTIAGDMMMDYDRCVAITDEFINELGMCINLSVPRYPDNATVYDWVFDGLQEVINLIHGIKDGLQGADGMPRIMDHQEARIAASDRVEALIDELSREIIRQETPAETVVRVNPPEPKKRLREGVSP